MVELDANGNIPLKTHARVYKVVDLKSGRVGYNVATGGPDGLEPLDQERIEGYTTFRGFVTELLPMRDAEAEVARLRTLAPQFEETEYTQLIARVKYRLEKNIASPLEGHSVLHDLKALLREVKA